MADKLLLGETVAEQVEKINALVDEVKNLPSLTNPVSASEKFYGTKGELLISGDGISGGGLNFAKPSGVKIIPYEEDENGNKTSYIGWGTETGNNNNQSVPTVHALMKFLYGEAIGSHVISTGIGDDVSYGKWQDTGEVGEDGSKKYELDKTFIGYTPIKGYNENREELVLRFMLDIGQEGKVVVFCDEELIGEVRNVLLAANGLNRTI